MNVPAGTQHRGASAQTDDDTTLGLTADQPVVKAFVAAVRPECLEDYRRLHDEPWPEVVALMQAAGIRDYHIYLDSERHLLFSRWTYVGSNLAADLLALKQNPVAKNWQETTLKCLVPVGDGTDAWNAMPSVFFMP
jgi:L-rhamnose mutarotase